MAAFKLVLVAVMCSFIFILADGSKPDHMEHLLVDLTKDYKSFVPPQNVSVSFGINYLCAMLDERSQKLSSRVFEKYEWTDPRLSWDPSKYGGIELVHIPTDLVWLPDNTRALNNVGEFAERDQVTVAVGHEGDMFWQALAVYKTFCTRSSTYRTDHAHHCTILFGPWSQGVSSLPMKLLSPPGMEIDNTLFFDQCPYVIDDISTEFTSKKYDCCPQPFNELSIHFDVYRRGMSKEKEEEKKEKINCSWPHCP